MADTQKGIKSTENKSKIEAPSRSAIFLYYTLPARIQIHFANILEKKETPNVSYNQKSNNNQNAIKYKFIVENKRKKRKHKEFYIFKRF